MGQMVVYENETGRGVEYSGELRGIIHSVSVPL